MFKAKHIGVCDEVFSGQLCNHNQFLPLFSWAVLRSVSLYLCSPIFFQSAMNGMSKSISHPNIAAPGEAFNTIWWVEQMAHAASAKKMSMSLALTNLAISSSAARSMFVNTA
jgi:hypothetical protein